jgi:phosphoglycolate phosphatase
MHVLFDLDGTLTDPKDGITSCIRYALAKLDRPAPPLGVLEKYIGPPLHESFVDLLGSIEAADRALMFYRERFGQVGLFENQMYAGIEESLERITNNVQSMYVVTSKPTVYSERIIDHFGLSKFFQKVYGSHLDGSLTDKSDLIGCVLESESLQPSETTMVGDRHHDILGAKDHGLRTIGALWGYGSRQELEDAGADAVCAEPRLLSDYI